MTKTQITNLKEAVILLRDVQMESADDDRLFTALSGLIWGVQELIDHGED
jgi:hypothetical protein